MPYVWAAGVDGRAAHSDLPFQVKASATFGDVLKRLHVGGMGAFEGHHGRVGFLTDIVYADLRDNAQLPVLGIPTRLATQTFTGLGAVQYRLVNDERGTLDAIGGARYWSIRTGFSYDLLAPASLPPGIPPAYARNQRTDWVDGVIGMKASVIVAGPLRLNVMGTMGTGGSTLTSDALMSLGYDLSRRTSLLLGYRVLTVDRHSGSLLFSATVHGPAAGIAVRF